MVNMPDNPAFQEWFQDRLNRSIRQLPDYLPVGLVQQLYPEAINNLGPWERVRGFPPLNKTLRPAYGMTGGTSVRWYTGQDMIQIGLWLFTERIQPGKYAYANAEAIASTLGVTEGEVKRWMDAGLLPREPATYSAEKSQLSQAIADLIRSAIAERKQKHGGS